MMVQHRPAEEISPTPAIGQTVMEEAAAERLYSTPVSRRDERPEAYNIRQQIGGCLSVR